MPASAPPPEKQALFKYKTQTSSCPAENHFNTNPPHWNVEYFSNWKWWETEQLHSAAAIRRKLREVVMCNYRPNSQFNSHNRTVQAVTPQQKPHLQRQDRWSKDGNFKKKPCGADIRRLIHGGGIKNHRWRNSIDVFDGGIWATIEQILTAASFPPFLFSLLLHSHSKHW